jgi:hypothetical protein
MLPDVTLRLSAAGWNNMGTDVAVTSLHNARAFCVR